MQTTKFNYQQQYENILKNNLFLQQKLRSSNLNKFREMIDRIMAVMRFSAKYDKQAISLGKHLQLILNSIDKWNQECSLAKIFKKLAIIFIILRKSIENNNQNEGFKKIIVQQLQQIKNSEFQILKKGKDHNQTIYQITQFFKDFVTDKPKVRPIQQQASKGVITEIIQKIYQPFCTYLLKLTQNIKQTDHQQMASNCIIWKAINLSKQLGAIVEQLHRICRYFRKDLSGIFCHFMFIISLDINKYYNSLRQCISVSCLQWKNAITEVKNENDYLDQRRKREAILKDMQFIELARSIEELQSIREHIMTIYLNKELKSSLKIFTFPTNGVQIQVAPSSNSITFIENFIDENQQFAKPIRQRQRTSIEAKMQVQKQYDIAQISTGQSISQNQFEQEE